MQIILQYFTFFSDFFVRRNFHWKFETINKVDYVHVIFYLLRRIIDDFQFKLPQPSPCTPLWIALSNYIFSSMFYGNIQPRKKMLKTHMLLLKFVIICFLGACQVSGVKVYLRFNFDLFFSSKLHTCLVCFITIWIIHTKEIPSFVCTSTILSWSSKAAQLNNTCRKKSIYFMLIHNHS